MTSQKSTNKKSISLKDIMREDFRHKTWMLALSILGNFLAGPVAALYYVGQLKNHYSNFVIKDDGVYTPTYKFVMTTAEFIKNKYDECLWYLTHFHLWLMLFIAFVGALIVGLLGFHFLYHKRNVDLFHSIPVSRRKLFTAIWLNGFLIWFVPTVISHIFVFTFIAFFLRGAFCFALLGKILFCLLGLTLSFLMVYHVCLVGVMLSGNTLNALIVSLVLGLIVVVCSTALCGLAVIFYKNHYVPEYFYYANPLCFLSPMITPFIWAFRYSSSDHFIPTNTYHWLLFAGTLLMIINLFLACNLYVKRRSELAERGLESKPVRILSRAIISILSGFTFALFLHALDNYQYGWMLFGLILGTFLAFCVLNVIFHASFKAVFSHKLQYLIVLVLCSLMFFGIMFDGTGYAKRLPNKNSITGITLTSGALSSDTKYYVMEDGILRRKNTTYDLEGPIQCSDPDKIYALLSACVSEKQDSSYHSVGILVKIYTKWGSYYRRYDVRYEDLHLLEPIIETKEYLEEHYPFESLCFGYPEMIEIYSSMMSERPVIDQTQITQLINAIHKDFEEHRGITELIRSSRAFSLELKYPKDNRSYTSFIIDIPYWYENTIQLVKEWYPKKNWDPSLDEIVSMDMDGYMYLQPNENFLTRLFSQYGFDEQGNPLETPGERRDDFWYENDYTAINWHFNMTDMDFLKELEPYLIWGYYNDPLTMEYEFLGTARMADGGTADCYVHYGKLPLEIIQKIEENAHVTGYYSVSDPEAYFYN